MIEEKNEEFQAILKGLSGEQTKILKEILEAEKSFLHRENLQGTPIVSQIMDIVKERVDE
ncbi:hypothetical protein ACFFJI_11560 [Allobacillus sp. GCM10007491]|uniref:Uncharacterized protein n=1 Tax=Allobacillus saliphilus TaxID=2912308 RepID=A0A941CWD4_9BACI|nr:hypothetical protein [Allobacillus saliphilus]MBR7553623.1 hypothetical protein [Allobacillus saliphilus]